MRTSTLGVHLACVFLAAQLNAGAASGNAHRIEIKRREAPPAAGPLVGLSRLEVPGGQGVIELSGVLWLDADDLLLASDEGMMFRVRATRDGGGRLVGLADWAALDLPLPSGWSRDFEGLAISAGELVVSVEAAPHIVRFEGPPRAPRRVRSYLGWADRGIANNKGIEALTDLPDGGWLAIVERRDDQGHPALTRDGRQFVYEAADGFQPTAADRHGDRLFILERRVSLLGGWQARLTCLEVGALDGSEVLRPELVARFDYSHGIDNMEALGVREHLGDLEFLLISDDNGSPLQRTLFLHYRWPKAASGDCRGPRAHQPAEGQEQTDRHAELRG